MTVAVVKTKAEQDLRRQFEELSGELPGGGWVAALRREAIGAFEAFGLPSRRVEAFKYTDLKQAVRDALPIGREDVAVTRDALDAALGPLSALDADRLVLVNGRFASELSDTAGLGDCAEFISLGPLLAKAPSWLESKFNPDRIGDFDAVTALNAAFMRDGILLKIKPGETAKRPVLVLHVRAGGAPVAAHTRNIVAIEAGAAATVVEVFVALDGSGAGQYNSFADIEISEGGHLVHGICRLGDGQDEDVGHTAVRVGPDATYAAFHYASGARLVRQQAYVQMIGEGGTADISGVFLGRERNHIDTTLVVDHMVPGAESRELFKGVLDGHARGVFQGKVIVRPDAQKTDGQMMAQALMLSEDCEFDSKPELEIYADDVQCGHGSTCVDLDKDLIFFCRSRGLSEAQAKALLIRGFAGEVIDRLDNEGLRDAVHALSDAWLDGRT